MNLLAQQALMMASGGTPTGVYTAAVLALSPIDYFRLNEVSGTSGANLGSRAQVGTYAGTYTLGNASLLPNGEGLSLAKSGNGRLSYSRTSVGVANGSPNKPFSICLWIRRTGTIAADKVLVALGPNNGAQLALTSGNLIRGGASGNFNLSTGPTVIALNTNYFIVWTINAAGSYKYYVNGALDFTGSTANNFGSSNDPATVGIYGDVTSFPFPGNLQEYAVFNRELSAAEVTALWTAAQ